MSTDTVSPLRQRMIEDMNSRKLVRTRRGATSTGAPGKGQDGKQDRSVGRCVA
jgi:hypothetical protein